MLADSYEISAKFVRKFMRRQILCGSAKINKESYNRTLTMKKIVSNSINVAVSLLISAVILYFVYRNYDFSGFRQGLADMKLTWLWLALACSALGPVFRGLRWTMLLEPAGYKVPVRDSILIVFTGYAANIIIPRIGEISRCAILDRYGHVPFSKSFGTLVAERFVDMILLVLITVVTIATQSSRFIQLFNGSTDSAAVAESSASGNAGTWIWIGTVVAAILIIWIICRTTSLWQRIVSFVKDFWSGFIALRQVRNLPLFIAYSIGIWLCYYFEMYFAFYCISSIAALGPLCGLVCFVAGSIAVLVPTPNGAGPWHFAITSMMVIYGVALADAQTFALVLHTAQTATYLLCGAIAWIVLHFVRHQ